MKKHSLFLAVSLGLLIIIFSTGLSNAQTTITVEPTTTTVEPTTTTVEPTTTTVEPTTTTVDSSTTTTTDSGTTTTMTGEHTTTTSTVAPNTTTTTVERTTTTSTYNAPPVAKNDTYSTNANTTLNQAAPGVLSNDTDPEGATLTTQLVSSTSHGSLTFNTNGSFAYTPVTDYSGNDSFTYRAIDRKAKSNVATVTIIISNIAPLAKVTASSETPLNKQLAIKAVDGFIDGFPGDYTREWVTNGEKSGAWLKLSWSIPYAVDRVVLYDRPNLGDNILGATLTFSDDSSLKVGPLNNDGTATEATFLTRVITSMTMTVTGVSGSTQNVGLAEILVFGPPMSKITTTIPNSTTTTTSISNIAPLADVTASSETPLNEQLAIKAVDGVIDGYPGDITREWATDGEKSGAWLKLSWSAPYSVDRVVLYDRPNLGDNILSATLTFSDDSSLDVGPLNNDGTATEATFLTRVITSMTMTATGVSPTTENVGLAEIQVFGTAMPTTTSTISNSTTTTTICFRPCCAEAIYGENSEQTELLRKYRDKVLSKTPEGREIIETYYKFCPIIIELLEQRPLLKNRAKAVIDSMLPGIRKKVEESYKNP